MNKRIETDSTYRSQFDERVMEDYDGNTFPEDTFSKIGEYTILAGEVIQVGFGESRGQHSAEGRIYADIRRATNEEWNGVLRIEVHNPRDRHRVTLFESRTETLRTSAADRRQQLAFPRVGDGITKDYKVVLTFRPDDEQDFDHGNTNLAMDITVHDVRG